MKRFGLCVLFFSVFGCVFAQEDVTKLKLQNSTIENKQREMRMDVSGMDADAYRHSILSTMKYSDYMDEKITTVDEDFRYKLFNSGEFSPGLMSTRKAGGEVGWQINQAFNLRTGLYAMQYDYNFGWRPYYDAVPYVNLSYKVNSWLTLGAYGQYSVGAEYNVKHGSILPAGFVPRTAYGISATAMFNKIFGVYGSAGKEFDPFSGQWRNVYELFPVINFNALFK